MVLSHNNFLPLSRREEHLNPPAVSRSDRGNELFCAVVSALKPFEEDSLLGHMFLGP